MAYKKLYRSRDNVMIAGICSGLAEYFDIDPSLVRLATVLLIFPGGLSFWAYIVAWIIIPQKPLANVAPENAGSDTGPDVQPTEEEPAPIRDEQDKTKYVVGIILVALGLLFLFSNFNIFAWFSFFKLWPIILIIIGAIILIKGLNKGGVRES
jgi:phage shock protein C